MHPRSERFREILLCARTDNFHGSRWYVIPLNGKLSGLIGLDSAPARTPTCSQLILQLTFGNCVFDVYLHFRTRARSSRVRYEVQSLPGLSVTCVSWEDCKIPSGARAFLRNSRCGSRERSRARSPLPGRVCLDDSGGLGVSRAPEFSSISI